MTMSAQPSKLPSAPSFLPDRALPAVRLISTAVSTGLLFRETGGRPGGNRSWGRLVAAVAGGFLAGSIPVSNVAARRAAGLDLRDVGSGTVSGTGLYEVAGFPALALAGIVEVAKGAVGPLIAGVDEPVVAAVAAGAAVTGHDWSPFLRGSGGRGISPAMGALLPRAPAGAAVLLAGLALGRLAGETALGSLVADLALVPVVRRVHGRQAGWSAAAVLVPIVAKRLAGNRAPLERSAATYFSRLVFDRDSISASASPNPVSDLPGAP
jgi:acyl phosphate:glycerol-3-phosphate acyltransferase